MQWWHALILGVVEGATEFLPISSTYHLLLVEEWLGIGNAPFAQAFAVIIQAGALVPVWWQFFQLLKKNYRLLQIVVASFIPTAIVGFLAHKIIKTLLFPSLFFTTSVFILVGVLFLLLERVWNRETNSASSRSRNWESLSLVEAVGIGCAQALAVIPGVSRAGAVIIGLRGLGLQRAAAVEYSFLLAVPTITMAALFDAVQNREIILQSGIFGQNSGLIALGLLAAFLSASAAISWLLHYVRHHDFTLFGWYRIVLGLLTLTWLLGR